MTKAQEEEYKILLQFYLDLEHGLDEQSRGYRLAFVERLLEEVRTKLEQIEDTQS